MARWASNRTAFPAVVSGSICRSRNRTATAPDPKRTTARRTTEWREGGARCPYRAGFKQERAPSLSGQRAPPCYMFLWSVDLRARGFALAIALGMDSRVKLVKQQIN